MVCANLTSHRALVVDYGTKYLGIALANCELKSAQALCTLRVWNNVFPWQELRDLLHEWQCGLVVVGLPINMNGTDSNITSRARNFAGQVTAELEVDCQMHDERLTSWATEMEFHEGSERYISNRGKQASMRQLRRLKKNNALHADAARLIALSWLHHNETE